MANAECEWCGEHAQVWECGWCGAEGCEGCITGDPDLHECTDEKHVERFHQNAITPTQGCRIVQDKRAVTFRDRLDQGCDTHDPLESNKFIVGRPRKKEG